MIKKISLIKKTNESHWVGDGFPVRSLFTYNDLSKELSPFLLLDYAGPAEFPSTTFRRGVGPHPHRGFETVTIVYAGEVEHRDSSGGGGVIGPGDVQWMTAGSGVVHEEFHGTNYAKRGGPFQMIQLWVNLPTQHKKVHPRYQSITSDQIPQINFPEQAGFLRVIAGMYDNVKGPACTFTPINLWDVKLKATHHVELKVPQNFTTAIVLLNGQLQLDEQKFISPAELVLFELSGDTLSLKAKEDTQFLILNGEPIDEPVVGSGPFVMNTEEEIRQAYADFKSGKMGQIPNR